ncbi:hypothetical protein PENTCL1PPCAC_23821, partial [Pristionchus entomophagus]
PPPRKKEKKEEDEEKKLPSDCSKSGVIRFEVVNSSTLDDKDQFSEEIEVGGVYWRATVLKRARTRIGRKGVHALCVYLYGMVKQSSPWRIDVEAEYILINSDESKHVKFTRTNAFNQNNDNCGGVFLEWKELMDKEKEFIKDDKINVEIRLSITNMRGAKIVPRADFTNPNDPLHDVALVIGGEKIYVNKGYLSLHSPVFHAMFNSGFAEKNKNEIELK